ncbi:MAG: NUDIX hydrolase [Myxococcaceae bacterium]|nr:NUDIX hydrolase [Myxococcaceae bacterium]
MPRESSAGGVVVREHEGVLEVAVIRPRGKQVWALPKGHVDKGEKPEEAAAREVLEETGLRAHLERQLGEIRYVYQFRGARIFKTVVFFLFRYEGGEIDVLDPKMRVEVDQAKWVPLENAHRLLAYRGEKEILKKAQRLLLGQGAGTGTGEAGRR